MQKPIKKVLVCGAGGFIGHHLVRRLKSKNCWVRGVGRRQPEFSKSLADDFLLLDLRNPQDCEKAIRTEYGVVDEVYQLAADMGGIGYITQAASDILKNNTLMNIHMVHAAASLGVKKYFFSSSVCVYRDMKAGEQELSEEDAIPAHPDNEYGWEKLFSEQVVTNCGKKYGMPVRIGRLQTSYGPQGTWRGGKEKAPAAICRKVAEASEGDTIEIWGDGTAVRSFLYIDDMTEAMDILMQSPLEGPVNIGSPDYVPIRELVEMVIKVSGKKNRIKYIPGPVGVHFRNFSNNKIYSTGWRPKVSLEEGIKQTYSWIEGQVLAAQKPIHTGR